MNKPSDYVIDLFHKLREDISAIKHRLFTEKPEPESVDIPRQYTIEAIQKKGRFDEKEENAVHAVLNLPESIRINAKTEQQKDKWFKDRLVWLQVITIGVGALVAVIYFGQWRVMISAVDATRQASERDERAWIKVLDVENPKAKVSPNEPLEWDVQIQNIGKTPARMIHGQFLVEVIPSSSEPDLDYGHGRTVIYVDRGILYPQDVLTHPVPVTRRFNSPDNGISPLQPSEYESLTRDESYIVLHGQVGYEDTFHVRHWVKFCRWFTLTGDYRQITNCANQGNDADYADEP